MSHRISRRGLVRSDPSPVLRSASRRRALQTLGMAGLATVALPWLRLGTAHAAADKTLRILQWSHFVPAYDAWFDAFAQQWSEENGVQVSVDHINIVDLVTTTTSELWEKAGMPQGPDTWQDLLEVGEKIRQDQGVQVGIGMSQELDSNMVARSVLWSWGATVQDENDNVVLGHGKNRELAIEAVKYMVDLYERTMTPAVFAWNPASNNQDLIAGKASYIVNSISAYRSAQDSRPDIARDVFFTGPRRDPKASAGLTCTCCTTTSFRNLPRRAKTLPSSSSCIWPKITTRPCITASCINSPSFFDTPIPGANRGYPAAENAQTLKHLHEAWFADDPFRIDDEEEGKLASLTTDLYRTLLYLAADGILQGHSPRHRRTSHDRRL